MVIPAVSSRTIRGATPSITVTEGRFPDEKGLRNLYQQTFAGCRQSALKVEGVRSSSPETGSFIWMMMFCSPATPAVLSVWPAAASYPDRNRAAAKADAIFIQSCWSTVRPMAERELWPSISGGKRSVSMFPPSGVQRSGPLERTAEGELCHAVPLFVEQAGNGLRPSGP